jgi:hypothetical protein
VRRRAQALILVAQVEAVMRVAKALRMAAPQVRARRDRFLDRGRDGLVDKPRAGCPPKLGPTERALREAALEQGPQAYGRPVAVWSIRGLGELRWPQCPVRVSGATVHRAVLGLGGALAPPAA